MSMVLIPPRSIKNFLLREDDKGFEEVLPVDFRLFDGNSIIHTVPTGVFQQSSFFIPMKHV